MINRTEYFRQYRALHREKVRTYNREYNQKYRKEHGYQNEQNSKERYPERQRARMIVRNAIKNKSLKRKPCEVCGNKVVEGHHTDYSKPLEVTWLCKTHHVEADRLIHNL